MSYRHNILVSLFFSFLTLEIICLFSPPMCSLHSSDINTGIKTCKNCFLSLCPCFKNKLPYYKKAALLNVAILLLQSY